MAEITRREGWGREQIERHHREMVELLQADLALHVAVADRGGSVDR